MSPNKMLVESATMIFIISFMLAMFVMLVERFFTFIDTSFDGCFGLIFTFGIAVRHLLPFGNASMGMRRFNPLPYSPLLTRFDPKTVMVILILMTLK